MDSACLHKLDSMKDSVPTVAIHVHVNYPVSTCSVDTHNTKIFYSSVTLTNHCSTLKSGSQYDDGASIVP